MPSNKNRFTTTIKKETGHKEDPLTFIIPVAGMGHRMKSYGPKCLLSANSKESILDKSIHNIHRAYPDAEIIVVVGFEADKVIRILPDNIRIVENQSYNSTNVVESLRLAINNTVSNRAVIVYGDLIFNLATISGIADNGSSVVVDSKNRFKNEEVGVTVVEDHVTSFAYGLETKWSHIVYMAGKEFSCFKSLCTDRRRNKMYPFELFNTMISKGCSFRAIEPKGMTVREIDSLKDL